MKPVKAEIEVVGQETLTYQSEEKQVYVLDGTLDMMGGTTIKQWISPDGVNYRTETLLMGVSQVATKTDRETALGDIEEVDLVLKTRILPAGKRPIPKAKKSGGRCETHHRQHRRSGYVQSSTEIGVKWCPVR
jgi:hypothetical protein